MKQVITYCFCLCLLGLPGEISAQGSWEIPEQDLSFPRTVIDSLEVPLIRSQLGTPDIFNLYASVWQNANATVPAGNSTDIERINRAMIAKEAAFVLLMDRRPSTGSIFILTQPERDLLLARALNILENLNTVVETGSGWLFYNPWQHRSKELITCLIAYDLLRGAGISTSQLAVARSRLLTFTANLYFRAMDTYTAGLTFFTYQFNNHSIMTASALGLAAIVFNDNSSPDPNYQPLNWINAGMYNLDNTLWVEDGTYPRVSEGDSMAGYAEGPAYFNYGFQNAFPFIRAMGNFLSEGSYKMTFNGTMRSIPNPWSDDRYDRLYDWMNKIRMPDGSCPAIHDSQMGFGTTIMSLSGDSCYNWPNPGFTPNDPFIRVQYIAANVSQGSIGDSAFQALPTAGSLIFRSSWATDAIYMHFIGKHGIALSGAKAHHQGDASSFSLAAYGKLMAIDPGYASSTLSDLTNTASNHSLILVNGSGPLPPDGENVSTETNTAYIENYFDCRGLDYGEVRTDYAETEVVRKNLFVRNSYFVLTDFIASPAWNIYTFQLHGNGLLGASPGSLNGSFVPDFSQCKGTYQRESVSLTAQILALNGVQEYSCELDSMAISSSVFRRYSRMLATTNPVDNTVFLTILFPYTSDSPQIQPVFPGQAAVAARINAGNNKDIVFATMSGSPVTLAADSTGMNKAIRGDAKINFYSETDAGDFSGAFIQYGDSIRAGSQVIIQAGQRLDVAYEKVDEYLYAGYISGSSTVKLYSPEPLQALEGPIASVTYNASCKLATVIFSGKGNFLLGTTDLSWNWTGVASADWHDTRNWSMSGHLEIHGLPVSANDVLIPADAVQMPVVMQGNPAACNNLTIEAGAILSVLPGRAISVNGNLTLQGP